MSMMNDINKPESLLNEKKTNELEQIKLDALQKLIALGGELPTATTLIDISTDNVFAELGV